MRPDKRRARFGGTARLIEEAYQLPRFKFIARPHPRPPREAFVLADGRTAWLATTAQEAALDMLLTGNVYLSTKWEPR